MATGGGARRTGKSASAPPARGRPTPLLVALVAIAGTLAALAVVAWIAWRPEATGVVVAVPEQPASSAPGADAAASGRPAVAEPERAAARATPGAAAAAEPAGGAAAAEPAAATTVAAGESQADEPAQVDSESNAEAVDENATDPDAGVETQFAEIPAQVVRRSNIRTRPTPNATSLGIAEVGSSIVLLEAEAVRGYKRVIFRDRRAWIWGPNVAALPQEEPAGSRDSGAQGAGSSEPPANEAR
ncbi:MAG: hypothetical protein JNM75_14385 [Rhodospirillales bacterium]|nr:hypothetical protein [Rhodospirillales bacterium]